MYFCNFEMDFFCNFNSLCVVLLRTGFLISLDFLVISAPTFSGGSVPGSFLDFLDLFSLALFSLGGLEVSSPEVGCGRDEPMAV